MSKPKHIVVSEVDGLDCAWPDDGSYDIPNATAYTRSDIAQASRLERIATAAMQGIVSDAGTVSKMMMSVGHNDDAHYQLTAKVSLGYARALIAEIDKESDT